MLSEGRSVDIQVNEAFRGKGGSVYWRHAGSTWKKDAQGKKTEIPEAEYSAAKSPAGQARAQKAGRTIHNTASKSSYGIEDGDDTKHRDRQVSLGFSRNGWVSKESMDLAETPASQIKGKKDVKTIKTEPGQKVTPESLKGLMGIGKPAAFKAIADALNNGEEIGQAEVDGDRILYYGDHVIVK
jgi:hypothetical protein